MPDIAETAALTDLSATEIARRVRAGALSAREVTEAALARIAATEPRANAFIHVDAPGARAAADAVDGAIAAGRDPGPLAGVPVSVKDLVHVAGQPTSFGSRAFAGTAAPGDAIPVARLRAAGAVLVGKTTTPEFGHKPVTAGPLFGETLNPWNSAFTAGGSSGGAAVSVALRQVPLAVGTDGGGSIRIPASICGVWGLKATLGRIPHGHAPDLFANNSYIGPMARTADDLRLMYEVMAGAAPQDPWSKCLPPGTGAAPARPRIGWALRVGNRAVEPDVAAAVEAAVGALAGLGADVQAVEIDLAAFEPSFRTVLETAVAARTGARVAATPELFDPTFVTTVENGNRRTGAEVQAAAAARSDLYRLVERHLSDVDYLVTPTVAAASLPADTDVHADVRIAGENCGRIRAGWYPYTFPLNLTGHPALALPCGWDRNGLPIGLQIVGRWYDEDGMLDLAARLAAVLRVEQREPPL
jgi:aspartyl-tRNA(Asn)/glutamyl-tRNA(Gln) amidotransferase subunit A